MGKGLIERLRARGNWMRESCEHWKDATLVYDDAPKLAADRIEMLEAALEGVVRVADRNTPEFDAARAALQAQEPDHDG